MAPKISRRQISVTLDPDVVDQIDQLTAAMHGMTRSDIVELALLKFFRAPGHGAHGGRRVKTPVIG